MKSAKRPVALIILDGWGINSKTEGNAVAQARTPNLDRLKLEYPSAQLSASGEDVGLMEGQMGDSNVGHLNMGAGRIVYQYVALISKAVRDGSFFENPKIIACMDKAKKNGRTLHLMGLVSPGGVHSHSKHLYALLEMAAARGLSDVCVHAFLDGRDVPPASAGEYIAELEREIERVGCGRIATVSGRYYAMDRDKRWDRVQKAYFAMVKGEGLKARSGSEAVRKAYERGETDEFVVPTVIVDPEERPVGRVSDGDSLLFFNFRSDRAREITWAFVLDDFDGFDRGPARPEVNFLGMTRYDEALTGIPYAFAPQDLSNTLGAVVSKAGLRQLRIAETEKYAHVTFFFSGGVEEPFEGEERILVPSPKVPTYDLKPEMSAYEVADRAVERILQKDLDLIVLNFANLDMVGHTGVMSAAIQAVEAVDECVGRVVNAVRNTGGCSVVTADHGNSEQMVDYQTGEPHTAHTTNPVPVILVDDDLRGKCRLRDGTLADVAPTVLELMGLEKPAEMTGTTLIETL